MRNTKVIALSTGLSVLTVAALVSGCVVRPYGGIAVEAPAPVVSVDVYPDDYVWDGYEYIGVVGGVYYYLGPNHVWIRCEPFRVARFHDWERVHPDWHAHATHNVNYRGGNGQHENHGDQRDHDHDYGH